MCFLGAARLLPSQIMQYLHTLELLIKDWGANQDTTETDPMLISSRIPVGCYGIWALTLPQYK